MAESESGAGPTSPSGADAQQSTSLTLLERLRARDGDAWRVMVQLYTPLVYRWCGRGGVREADVEDVAQEVFRQVAAHIEDFRRDRPGDSFRGWLHGVTRNMLLAHFRRAGRSPKAKGGTEALLQLQEVEAAGESQEDDSAVELDGLRRRALEMVRSEFETRTWQAFWQTVVEDRSPADVAADMGVSPTAVRMAKSRVLRRLKEAFGDLIK